MTFPDLTAIAHLDFHPRCEFDDGECGRAATVLVDQHGCDRHLLCNECFRAELRRCRQYVHPRCLVCDQSFPVIDDMITVEAL
ncbi:hypothetical protein [Nocardia ignorata]|uniref:Uncharacterized protein n=1 Tax=Nocardia ignorata TaxID=145285 RepID=A0A4R6NYG6_NOCIG|nr:hypothetical protein [Nocardia ignorata]TDP29816.1 hypothetical protein DFR75_11284 [Nocardia ignorata]